MAVLTLVLAWSWGPLALAQALPTNATDSTLARIRATKTVVIAYRTEGLPFSFLGADAQPAGYSIDLCNTLVARLRLVLNLPTLRTLYVPINNEAENFTLIDSGRADLDCSTTTHTRSRDAYVSFLVTSFLTGTRVMVNADAHVDTLPGLRGHRVGVIFGSTNEVALRARDASDELRLKIISVTDRIAAARMLQSGEIDAFASDEILLYGLRAGMLRPTQWTLLGDYLSYEPYAIMLAHDQPHLKAILDRFVRGLIADGSVESLQQKWLNSPIPGSGVNFHMPPSELQRSLLHDPNDRPAED